MKLIYCKKCRDVVSLIHEVRECQCKESAGLYLTEEVAVYVGPCEIFGIDNISFQGARLFHTVFSGWFYGYTVPHHGTCIYLGETRHEL